MLHRLLIGFLNTSLSNSVQKTSKIGQFLRKSQLYDTKKLASVFSFSARLTVKQASSLLSISMSEIKK